MHTVTLKWFLVFGFWCLISACGSSSVIRPTSYAPCIDTTTSKGLIIRWGTEHDSVGVVEGFQLDAHGYLFSFNGRKGDTALVLTDAGFVEQQEYCTRAAAVKEAFLRTQAMNVRGARGRFVEYRNPATGVYLRVVWNPDLQTFQSRFFRAEYDSLQLMVSRANH
jgi:hypothetical protein